MARNLAPGTHPAGDAQQLDRVHEMLTVDENSDIEQILAELRRARRAVALRRRAGHSR